MKRKERVFLKVEELECSEIVQLGQYPKNH
jgi:hypothetical protein